MTVLARTGWSPLVTGPLAVRARQAAEAIAGRLAGARSHGPSLAAGSAGLALVGLYLARTGDGNRGRWLAMAETHLRDAAAATQAAPLRQPGLFGGTAGLALTLADLCRDEPRYGPSLDRLRARLAEQVRDRTWRRPEPGVADQDYDAVSGAAGVLAAVADTGGEATTPLLEYLSWLGGPGRNWHIPPHLLPLNEYREQYPHGYLNVGLAHGAPGPLAALALAWRAGHRIPGQREAVEHLAGWLVDVAFTDAAGPNWPVFVPLTGDGHEQRVEASTRTAWCYGAPGVAAALWLAGEALDDDRLRDTATEAVAALTRRIAAEPEVSPTLCHGNAGLLMVCLHFARRPDGAAARACVPVLVERILERCDPDLPYVVQDRDAIDGALVDIPGLISGAAGVALALLAASTPVAPRWTRALLLA